MIHEYLHLLHDWPHILFEATWDGFLALLSFVPIKRFIRRHDKEKHGTT